MKWPQDFDGKHAVAGEAVAAEHSGVDEARLRQQLTMALGEPGLAANALDIIRPYLHPTPSQVSAEELNKAEQAAFIKIMGDSDMPENGTVEYDEWLFTETWKAALAALPKGGA